MAIQRALISGGGTGGHIFPAIAIADEIKRRNPKAEILFIGAENRMEMMRVPKAGYDIVGLPVIGIQRKLTLKNLQVPIKLYRSLTIAKKTIKEFNPEVVIGVGGYASAPSLWTATGLAIPSMIQEQNSYAGLTNKLLGRRVQAICVAYEGMSKFFAKDKISITGNPVRKDLISIDASLAEAQSFFDLSRNKKTVLIFGGSLGARTLNNAMKNAYERLKSEVDYQVIWQCGGHAYDKLKSCDTASLDHVHLMPFIDRMDLAYKAADLVICRSGALTVSELTVIGKASVLVPSPNVAEDHQTKNAQALVDQNAASLVLDREVETQLVDVIKELINNEEKLSLLAENALKMGKPQATENIVDIAESIIK